MKSSNVIVEWLAAIEYLNICEFISFPLCSLTRSITQQSFSMAMQMNLFLVSRDKEIITVKGFKSKKKKLTISFFVMLVKKFGWAIQKKSFAKTNQDSTFSHTSDNSYMFNPFRPTGHWCPANVIAYIFTIKLLHLLFLGTIDQGKVNIYKKI